MVKVHWQDNTQHYIWKTGQYEGVEFPKLRTDVDHTDFQFWFYFYKPGDDFRYHKIIDIETEFDKSWIEYKGQRYSGIDGFKKLIIVLEQEKVAKLLDTL